MSTQTQAHYRTIDDVAAANKRSGGHWFDADTLRYFGGRVSETIYQESPEANGTVLFVSSERDSMGAWDRKRKYTIRRASRDGSVETVSEFGEFATLATAHRHAAQYAQDAQHGLYTACRNDEYRPDGEKSWQV